MGKLCVTKVCVTELCVKGSCVTQLCVTELSVEEFCVRQTVLFDKVACEGGRRADGSGPERTTEKLEPRQRVREN